MSKSRFAELVEQALAEVPQEFAEFLEEVPVEVRDRPSSEQLANVPPGRLLLGLYQGRPRPQRGIQDTGAMPDIIFIFQHTIEQVCHTEAELVRQVRTTVLHEIGHHFGMNEQDLDRLGYG